MSAFSPVSVGLFSSEDMFQAKVSTCLAALEHTLYITMMGLGFYFIYKGNVVQRFQRERTNFAVYEEIITELPTIVTYIRLPKNRLAVKYGQDFNIQYQSGTVATLGKGTNLTFGQNTIKNSQLKVKFEEHKNWPNTYQITAMNYRHGMPLDYLFTYIFDNSTPHNAKPKSQIGMSLSTENGTMSCNSHKYHDGEVQDIFSVILLLFRMPAMR